MYLSLYTGTLLTFLFLPFHLVGQSSVYPRIKTAELGDPVTFTCTAANVPRQFFTWTRVGQGLEEIQNGSQYSVTSVTGSSQLTIKSITVDDQGYYVCNVVNLKPPDKGSDKGYLQVLSKCGFIVSFVCQ